MKIDSLGTVNSVNPVDNISSVNTNEIVKLPANLNDQIPNQPQGNNQDVKNNDKVKNDQALKIANEAFNGVNVGFRYYVDPKTQEEVIKVINTKTNEEIRQYPPQEILNMLSRIYDMLGILVDKKV